MSVHTADQFLASSGITILERTLATSLLHIPSDAELSAPTGHELTLTVDGEQVDIAPGTYRGDVVVTLTAEHSVTTSFEGLETVHHRLRQALYLDDTGIVANRSALAAAPHAALTGGVLHAGAIVSRGHGFNGVYVAGGSYRITGLELDFIGDSHDDVSGAGAGVVAAGTGTALRVDGARIRTRGVVRAGVVAQSGSRLVVTDSDIESWGGHLPEGYVSGLRFGQNWSAPWMVGVTGTARATLLAGEKTQATYIGSRIIAHEWGVLANEFNEDTRLTAINSELLVPDGSGYGAFSIAASETAIYGTTVDVPDIGVIVDGNGNRVVLGNSAAGTVARLNDELQLGLTATELAAIPERPTLVRAGRFGVSLFTSMDPALAPTGATAPSLIEVAGSTRIETGGATFIVKGLGARIEVDGSQGAALFPRNDVIVQVMDDDDPGPVMKDGVMLNIGEYREPIGAVERVTDFDTTVQHEDDAVVVLTDIAVAGNLFNAVRDGAGIGRLTDKGTVEPSTTRAGRNLVVELVRTHVTGMISASTATHRKQTIGAEDYRLLGVVDNAPGEAVNNGVIVSLHAARWRVTGTSHLTGLVIDENSWIETPEGAPALLRVDGQEVPVAPGDYRGRIVVSP